MKRQSSLPQCDDVERKRRNPNIEAAELGTNGIEVCDNTSFEAAVTDAENHDPLPQTRSLSDMASHGEKELRRERGDLLVKLFRENPSLAGSATARKAEKNLERAQMWEQITQKVNDAFGSRLEVLSVEKVKKLLTYYRRKDDGSYDNLKASCQSVFDDASADGDLECSSPQSRSDSVISGQVGSCDNTVAAALANNVDMDQRLQNLIASICSPSSGFLSVKSDKVSSPQPAVYCDTIYQLKRDRHEFVVSTAEYYMERMCFDSTSRTAQVNAERHNMWVKVTHLTNEKFMGLLFPLGVEQTKKLYSNCKRRRRLRSERNGGESPTLPLAVSSVSTSPDEGFSEQKSKGYMMSPVESRTTLSDTTPTQNLQDMVRVLDPNVQISVLRRQLADREEEVARLHRVIAEQAVEYKARLNVVVDLFKAAVDEKVSEDIRLYLNLA